jgi:hypothetical protein
MFLFLMRNSAVPIASFNNRHLQNCFCKSRSAATPISCQQFASEIAVSDPQIEFTFQPANMFNCPLDLSNRVSAVQLFCRYIDSRPFPSQPIPRLSFQCDLGSDRVHCHAIRLPEHNESGRLVVFRHTDQREIMFFYM